jgi:uncharacterized membrane protein YqjE
MPEQTHAAGKGLFESLAVLATTLVAVLHTRLELLSNDLEEDREHLFLLIIFALVALFCMLVSMVLATILLVTAFWDTHRLLVLALSTGFFLATGVAAFWFTMHKASTKPRVFSGSLSELVKDRQQLDSR